ncbi:CapA family protein [Planktothrix agardhii]|uniref:CapA family protein n=1 Tax=Planktothrix agardhii TaxID=1160 RepID=UPI001D09E590|nr:CapA family protein [Planktothrix agardhii]MCB8788065.1 CapA family protein [Planktothrix agardhii 1025]MCF3610167.1 CapA family protein [Planktothrix agardhii 1027]MCF3643765.1 CapA family protein [Planktothrix agardhii 1026]CAD5923533.1 Capsule biosynthesis protein CapA [Planktothrix agardhii]
MVYAEYLGQPSIFELARTGDLRAISDLINTYLRPEGISARVAPPDHKGCLPVLVEFQQEAMNEGIVKFICHLLWKLNAPNLEGVKIAARYQGDGEILWKQSVRLVTPANQVYRSKGQAYRRWLNLDGIKFKTLRLMFMMGSAVSTFVLGCWVSYYEVNAQQLPLSNPQEKVVMVAPPPKRHDTVQAALEVVPVVQQEQVKNPQDPTVTLVFGGDVTLSDHFEDVIGTNYSLPFAQLPEYQDADVAMVNLENPLTRSTLRRPNKQFNFKADPESVKVLTEGGIDIVNLANNHTMDYEEPGLVETMATLDQAGIKTVGAGRDIKEARRPTIIEVKGQRIAYLGYYDADFHAATESLAGTNPRYDERVAADIKAIRDQVDWVVVNYHWGVELAEYPGDWQIDLARFTIDQGADVVIGHHPHTLQGAEIYKGRPIVYSLGNFIFGGNSRADYETAVLRVALNANHQMKVEFLPVEVTQYQAKVISTKKGEDIIKRVGRLSQIFDQPMQSSVVLDTHQRQIKQVDAALTEPTLPLVTEPKPESPPTATEIVPSEPPKTLFSEPMQSPVSDGSGSMSQTESPLPPKLETKTETQDDLKPYIDQPFIKDPFISLPSFPQAPVPSTQSYRGSNSPISFQIAIPKQQSVSAGSHAEIDLPLKHRELDQVIG